MVPIDQQNLYSYIFCVAFLMGSTWHIGCKLPRQAWYMSGILMFFLLLFTSDISSFQTVFTVMALKDDVCLINKRWIEWTQKATQPVHWKLLNKGVPTEFS